MKLYKKVRDIQQENTESFFFFQNTNSERQKIQMYVANVNHKSDAVDKFDINSDCHIVAFRMLARFWGMRRVIHAYGLK